jgi:hypothetical protein
MSILYSAKPRRPEAEPTVAPETRVAPGVAILVMVGLSLLAWAFLISVGMALRSVI